MNNVQSCPDCGTPLPAGTPVCPRCSFASALGDPASSIQHPAASTSETTHPFPPFLSRSFGDYELLEEIGRGGMGVVYRARQRSLNREVALKMILAGPFAKPEFVQRFKTEAEAAANLRHPNIVAIHEIGEHDSQHFYSMDYIQGRDLAEFVRETPLAPRAAVELLKVIAEAVHYAHTRGILHRDLKPSNILIDLFHAPHITDFGLAKRLDADSNLTLTGETLGSPSFASPEQAAGRHREVGVASDVYSLGAILYNLLTGRPPFVTESLSSTIHEVLHSEPVAPRQLNPSLPRDLETICLKCLEKNPAKRYASARELAEELDRWLQGEPIRARPIRAAERTLRWCQRRPVVAGLSAAVVVLVLSVALGSTIALVKIQQARQAEQRQGYYNAIALAYQHIQDGDIDRALELLIGCPAPLRHWEWGYLLFLCHQDLFSAQAATNGVKRLAFSDDGQRVMVETKAGPQRTWDWRSRKEFSVQEARSSGRESAPPEHSALRTPHSALDPASRSSGRESAQPSDSALRPPPPALDQAERLRLFFGDQVPREDFLCAELTQLTLGPDATTNSAFSTLRSTATEDGRTPHSALPQRLATVTRGSRQATLWLSPTNKLDLVALKGEIAWPRSLRFSPDGRLLVSCGEDHTARVWDAATGQERFSLSVRVTDAVFSPSGRLLVTTGADKIARVWDTEEGAEIRTLRGHRDFIEHLAFSPDERFLATASADGFLKVWTATPGREVMRHGGNAYVATFSPDGKTFVSAGMDWTARLWDAERGAQIRAFKGHCQWVNFCAFSPDGKRLATASVDQRVKVWDVETGEELLTVREPGMITLGVAFSPDGKRLATGSLQARTSIWDAETGARLHTLAAERRSQQFDHGGGLFPAYSPDGSLVVTLVAGLGADLGIIARLWDARTGEHLFDLPGRAGLYVTLGFHPSKDELMTATGERRLQFWQSHTGKLLREFTLRAFPWGVCYSRDGRRVLIVTSEHNSSLGFPSLEVWDPETGRLVLSLKATSRVFSGVEISRDGRKVVTPYFDSHGTLRQWEAFPWQAAWLNAPQAEALSRVREFAGEYWRDRLRAEREGKGLPPPDPSLWMPPRDYWPARDPNAHPRLIDLTSHYNGLLEVNWLPVAYPSSWEHNLAGLPRGVVELAQTPFDVRGVIQLRWDILRATETTLGNGPPPNRMIDRYPQQVTGIVVGRKAGRVHLLHGCVSAYSVPENTRLADVVLRFADGTQAKLELRRGFNALDFFAQPGDAPMDPNTVIAWTGNAAIAFFDRPLQLLKTTWLNPHPEAQIESLDFVSAMTPAAPFLIAVTLE